MKNSKFKLSVVILAAFTLSLILHGQVRAEQAGESVPADINPLAPMTSLNVMSSNNAVLETSYYTIRFTTSTTGVINTIEILFPNGFNITNAKIIEATGLPSGNHSIALQKFIYTFLTPMSASPGQQFMFMIGDVVNAGITTTNSHTLSVTTKDTAGVVIDGPTTVAFPLTPIKTAMLANNAVNSNKILDGSVATADIANGAVASAKIAAGGVGPTQLSNGSVWSTHILDGTVAETDLAFNPATQAELDMHKGVADHDGRYFTEAELSTPGTINTTANPVDWTKLKNVPAGFADGTDDAGGGASGWTDDGTVVRLTTITDNVGIGTTTPLQKLDVAGNVTLQNNGKFGLNNDLSAELRSIKLRSNYVGDDANAGTIAYRPSWDNSSLGIVGAGTSTTNRNVRIYDSITVGYSTPASGASAAFSGNVGIGTTNPGEKLVIGSSGNLLFKASLEDPGDVIFQNSTGVQKGRIWSNATAGSSLFLSSGDNTPDLTIDATGNVNVNPTNLTSYPSGWGRGLHTWDVYAEGQLGAGRNGSVNGSIDWAGHATVARITITSDMHLKKNINTIEDALNKIIRLRGVEFEWRKEEFPDRGLRDGKQIGLIAQEVEEVLPELVSVHSLNGQKSVEYANIVAVLIEAVKELKTHNDELQTRIEALENK